MTTDEDVHFTQGASIALYKLSNVTFLALAACRSADAGLPVFKGTLATG